jgi:hypothetical protein
VSVVIASEVFEHIQDVALDEVLAQIRTRLGPNGRLLVTVPNGYGWFELESVLWFKFKIGAFLEWFRLTRLISAAKRSIVGAAGESAHPSTIADSPHVQRFTLRGIRQRLESAGFDVLESRGSVLICGPISNLLFTGFRRVMAANVTLGRRWPALASDFQLFAVPRRPLESDR